MRKSGVRCHQIKFTIADAAIVFTPRHFICIGIQIRASDMMMRANLSTTQAAKETLGLIGASVAVGIRERVIDTLGDIACV